MIVVCNKAHSCPFYGKCGHKEPHHERDGCYVMIGDGYCSGAVCVPTPEQPVIHIRKTPSPHRRKKKQNREEEGMYDEEEATW